MLWVEGLRGLLEALVDLVGLFGGDARSGEVSRAWVALAGVD
jgi:hypothetical protein